MAQTKKSKILIVDDEEYNLKLLGLILESQNYDVETEQRP